MCFDFNFIFIFVFLYGFCVEKEGERLQERGDSADLASRRRKKQFPFARCPSNTKHTASSRPVFDNILLNSM